MLQDAQLLPRGSRYSIARWDVCFELCGRCGVLWLDARDRRREKLADLPHFCTISVMFQYFMCRITFHLCLVSIILSTAAPESDVPCFSCAESVHIVAP